MRSAAFFARCGWDSRAPNFPERDDWGDSIAKERSRKNAVMMRAVHGLEVITFRLAKSFQFLAQRGQFVERGGNLRRRNAGFNGVFNQSELLGFREFVH